MNLKKLFEHTPIHETFGVALLLSMVGGFLEAYTFLLRGGVFCNAQTGNLVLTTLSVVQGNFARMLDSLVPIIAFCLGSALAAAMRARLSGSRMIAWEHILLIIEIVLLFLVGFLPLGPADPLANITVSFICSMQFSTFRQTDGLPYANTFCTNNLRLATESIYLYATKKEPSAKRSCKRYIGIILAFCTGTIIGAVFAGPMQASSIWICCGILGLALAALLVG